MQDEIAFVIAADLHTVAVQPKDGGNVNRLAFLGLEDIGDGIIHNQAKVRSGGGHGWPGASMGRVIENLKFEIENFGPSLPYRRVVFLACLWHRGFPDEATERGVAKVWGGGAKAGGAWVAFGQHGLLRKHGWPAASRGKQN